MPSLTVFLLMVLLLGLIEGRGLGMWVLGWTGFCLILSGVLEHGGCVSSILPFTGSDYFSVDLVVARKRKGNRLKSYFKSERIWFRDKDFINLLLSWWREYPFVEGSRMQQLSCKLNHMKSKIKE